jgi:cytochrome c-type biogenesis protein CcmH
MIFWIAAAAVTAAAVAALLRPLLRPRGPAADPAEHDQAVYRDQLAEVERDRARGLLDDAQAEAARTEIGRRLLAAADRQQRGRAPAEAPRVSRANRRLALILAVLVPVTALAVYVPLGAPELPSQPLAQRDPAEREAFRAALAEAEALARRLDEQPDDAAGWIELAQRYDALGRYSESSDAYARAVGLTEGDPVITAAYGEALVNAAAGTVTDQAVAAFEEALAARPDDPRARFYLGLARAQAGDDAGALDRWRALMADTPADAPWLPMLRERIAAVAGRLGLDVAAAMPEPAPPARPQTGAGAPALSDDQMAGAAGMTAEERTEMIRGMVEGLAARLEREPDDLEGWLRLANAYRVLGEPARAAEALARAAGLAPEDPGVLAAYGDALLESAAGDTLPPQFVAVMERLLALDPDSPRALWFLGIHAAVEGRADDAEALWSRLLAQLEPGTPEHTALERQIAALRGDDGQ